MLVNWETLLELWSELRSDALPPNIIDYCEPTAHWSQIVCSHPDCSHSQTSSNAKLDRISFCAQWHKGVSSCVNCSTVSFDSAYSVEAFCKRRLPHREGNSIGGSLLLKVLIRNRWFVVMILPEQGIKPESKAQYTFPWGFTSPPIKVVVKVAFMSPLYLEAFCQLVLVL